MAEIIALSLVLSLDALFFGISFGVRGIRVPLKAFFTLSLTAFCTVLCSMLLGKTLSIYIPFCDTAGAFLLIGIGIWICADRKRENSDIREILDNPELSDMNRSGIIEAPEAIVMGITLSLDSSAAAISTGMSGTASVLMPFSLMTAQLLFIISGTYMGKKIKPGINGRYIAVISGFIIVIIGLYRLMPIFY